ncbi:MAG: alpha/beta hydrolase [Betaproteobacteria bacterium]|nr:alpha/beta hydrolase [Betaproteobacteria bacterium]
MKNSISKYDLLYNPRLSVPDFAQIAARWSLESERARATLDCYLDVPYGKHATECMDIFRSQGPSKGLLAFIHGGYWRSQDKSGYSFLARSLTRAGITVAIPNYALCPEVEVRDIVMQMVQACAWLYRNGSHFGAPSDRLFVCGHSAGGHLTAMMLACLWPIFAADLPVKTVKAGLSISGVFDLREITKVPSINNEVRLTPERAMEISPALLPPASDAPLYIAVGGDETGGFHKQHRAMLRNWKNVLATDIPCPGDNHFSILETLIRPSSDLFKKTLEMVGI